MQVQTFTLHKCECCHKTRKVYRDARCFYCITDHDGESCFDNQKIGPRVKPGFREELPSLDEINARIHSGENSKEVWVLKRKVIAQRNLYNKDATSGDSAYLARNK